MNRFRNQFTRLTLLYALAAVPAFNTQADSCNTDSCATSCSTSNNDCNSNKDCNNNNDCNTGCSTCHTIIATRPTHSNTAYRYLPFADQDLCEFNGGMTVGYMFNQTFNPCSLAKCAVGTNVLSFKGSAIATRNNATDLVADYFGLSPLFVGTLNLCPQVRNHSLKFESYWDFANWAEGLYLRADLTFSHQERTLFGDDCTSCLTDTTISNTSPFPVGYMGTGSVAAFATIQQALAGTGFGDVAAWKYGKFKFCKQSTNKIDGFSLDLGYDFIRSDDSHFGIFIRYVAPTGTKIDGAYNEFFFAPLVGNMHHNALGGGLNAHKELWANDCGDSLTVHLDGYALHLFDDCQVRSFDFNATGTAAVVAAVTASNNSCDTDCNSNDNCSTTSTTSAGCLSRYTLLKQLAPATSGTAGYTATGVDIPGINFATRNVTSSIGVQGDASLRFIYRHNGFSMQVGYNIFGRQEEKLCFRQTSVPCSGTSNVPFDANFSYGFKGCNGDYYYVYPTTSTGVNTFTIAAGVPVATLSNATSSNASATTCGTIDSGVTTLVGGTTVTAAGVDYKQAYNTVLAAQANAVAVGVANQSLTIAQTSAPAIALSNDPNKALNINSGRAARLVTNKGFVTLDYTWECCDWQPFLSLGGEVEGGSNSCDFKQWGVWLKGGFSF